VVKRRSPEADSPCRNCSKRYHSSLPTKGINPSPDSTEKMPWTRATCAIIATPDLGAWERGTPIPVYGARHLDTVSSTERAGVLIP